MIICDNAVAEFRRITSEKDYAIIYLTETFYLELKHDIDKFKDINDTFGHTVGDEALENTAKVILDETDRDSLAFRFAGDEFIVLIKAPAGSEKELIARTLLKEESIRKKAEEFNKSGTAPYKLGFSMGHAIYDTNNSDDSFFKSMDAEMYKDKQSK